LKLWLLESYGDARPERKRKKWQGNGFPPFGGLGQALRGNDGRAETDAGVDPIQEPPLRQALESRLRHRLFRLRRPSLCDRVKYGSDENGQPLPQHTELEKFEGILRSRRARANPHEAFEEDSGEGEVARLPIFDCRLKSACVVRAGWQV